MELVADILSWVFIIIGGVLCVTGAFGMVRFPEFWTRLHAASVAETGGMIFLVLGMLMQSEWNYIVIVKLLLIGVFLFITSPTASHAIANAALVSGVKPVEAKDGKDAAP